MDGSNGRIDVDGMDGSMDGWNDKRMDGRIDERIDGWLGWLDGWLVGWCLVPSSGGSNGDLYDIELVGVPQTLADVNHEELETRIGSLKERIDDFLRFYKRSSDSSHATTSNTTTTKGGSEEILMSPEMKKGKRPDPEKEARAIKAHLEELLAMLVEVALHQKKCQVAITNLGVDSSQSAAQGCSAGVRLICNALFGSCGGATPAGVPRRERGGEYKYDIVQ
mmetsp:Transcript_5585/g.11079  ORF Transcript_5585/g.11079 Transcript_5585/m.11079 type:complete len:222 (-) Transcript_5585:382-1047(-)